MNGRHRAATSPETKRWENEHLIPPRPSWMPKDTYRALRDIREGA